MEVGPGQWNDAVPDTELPSHISMLTQLLSWHKRGGKTVKSSLSKQ